MGVPLVIIHFNGIVHAINNPASLGYPHDYGKPYMTARRLHNNSDPRNGQHPSWPCAAEKPCLHANLPKSPPETWKILQATSNALAMH